MRAKPTTGGPRPGQHIAALAAMVVGCGASSHQGRYGGMLVELRRDAPVAAARTDGRELFAGVAELDRAALVDAVLLRNPDVESARQAWRAALAGVPQATAFEDPMLSYSFAPLSIAGADGVPYGQTVELAQSIPFFGKRRLAGEVAMAEAEAMKGELDQVRLELSVMTSNLYDDYYLAARALDINRHHTEILSQAKKSAEAQYVSGRASQQDPLQAEVELENLGIERVAMESMRDASIAQLNGLLHRAPDAPLPPPVAALAVPASAHEADTRRLEAEAMARRPERAAAGARIRGGRAAIDLARRESYPDLAVMGSYSTMWADTEHRWMIGLSLSVPLQLGRRQAAVDAAEARAAQATSQDRSLRDRIAVEVATAQLRVRESARVIELTEQRLVPAARDQLRAAVAGFTAGRNEFTAVIDAEKNQREVEMRLHTARAELWRRLAALDRSLGRPAGRSNGPGEGSGGRR
jgi:outer membrane protein, heavy metal efflux system